MRFNTDIISRLLLSSLMLYGPFSWTMAYDSVSSQMIFLQPWQGIPVIAGMVTVAIVIFVDVLLNSICHFHWAWAKRNRDHIYMTGAFFAITVLFLAGKYSDLTATSVYLYSIVFLGCLSHGIIDSYAKRPSGSTDIERRKYRREA